MSETSQLEAALKKASTEAEARPEFYQLFMRSSVYVVGRPEMGDDNKPNGHFQLKQWQQPDGTLALPIFATLESLQATLGKDEQFLHIPVIDLFRLTQGVTLVLTCDGASKAFKPEEISALLSSIISMDPLVKSLVKAIEENSEESRKEFYRVLINSEIYVLGEPKDVDSEATGVVHQMTEKSQFVFAACDHPYQKDQKILPFFSSMDHMKKVIKKDGKFLSFNALTFFALAKGVGLPLILNLGSEPHKIFSIEEIAFLLQSAVKEPFEAKHFAPGTKIFLGPPEAYPQEMVAALLDFLPRFPEVKAAYLTTMREGSEESSPILVIGFEAEGDLTPMFHAVGPLMNDFAQEGQAIDFARVQEGEKGLSEYLLSKVNPFYRRSKSSPKVEKQAVETETAKEEYDKPGFFGRLKRIIGGSKND